MPRKPKRPGFVITAAVLLFVYGGLMLVCSFCGAAEMLMLAAAPGPQAPPGQPNFGDMLGGERELAKRIPSYLVVDGCYYVLNLVLGATLILAGAGALLLKPFARYAGSGAAAAYVLMTLAYVLYTAVVVMPVNERILQEQMQNAPINMAGFASGMTWLTLFLLVFFALVFSFPIIGFLNAKKSRDAFAGKVELDPHEERMARLEALAEDDDYGRPRSRPPQTPGDTGIAGTPD